MHDLQDFIFSLQKYHSPGDTNDSMLLQLINSKYLPNKKQKLQQTAKCFLSISNDSKVFIYQNLS